MESPNSHTIIELGLDEIPSTSKIDSLMFHSLSLEVNPFHVIFDLNGVLITTCFDKGKYGKVASCTIIFQPRLKEFLEKCLAEFHVYIWSIAQHHNIYNYLDKIWCKIQISILFIEFLIRSFTCKICISCWINRICQFSMWTLMFFF
jgi:hypothetical protein